MTAYVDAVHEHELVTRTRIAAILIAIPLSDGCVNFKKTVETSTYGLELVA